MTLAPALLLAAFRLATAEIGSEGELIVALQIENDSHESVDMAHVEAFLLDPSGRRAQAEALPYSLAPGVSRNVRFVFRVDGPELANLRLEVLGLPEGPMQALVRFAADQPWPVDTLDQGPPYQPEYEDARRSSPLYDEGLGRLAVEIFNALR